DHLLSLYKKAGAQYFFALANHHDNLDLWNSSHHKWNSVKVGPKKDIIAGWAKAAKKQGLPLGLSIHAAHAWSWYEVAQRSDRNGALKGVPYDGRISKSDGQGKWWQGLDPQELYAQNHPLSQNSLDNGMIHRQWDWGNGVSVPSKEYCNQFLKRTIELIDRYEPELLYFDDTVLPFHELNDVGLQIVAHHYNKSLSRNKGSLKAVVNGKILNEMQRKCLVWDIERGQSNQIEPFTWQTDTCLGNWHYDTRVYENKRYKTAKTVIQTLVDVVSKNGNFLLSVPVKGNGEIDEQEVAILEEVGSWMKTNSECIFDTRPWKVFGEGPAIENAAPLSAQGFNEGKGKAFTAEDIRFTSKGPVLYAIVYGRPANNKVIINSLGKEKDLLERPVNKIELLGGGTCNYQINDKNAIIDLPDSFDRESYALVMKIA
ncbi:MAG: alpha-L-fucosidase, partial [Flavitalea sp.]